jgi:hypothetical protein
VQLWACNGGTNQSWNINFLPRIYNDGSTDGETLDAVASGDGTNGDQIQLWTWHSGTDQEWTDYVEPGQARRG